jgi:hypothetical protein
VRLCFEQEINILSHSDLLHAIALLFLVVQTVDFIGQVLVNGILDILFSVFLQDLIKSGLPLDAPEGIRLSDLSHLVLQEVYLVELGLRLAHLSVVLVVELCLLQYLELFFQLIQLQLESVDLLRRGFKDLFRYLRLVLQIERLKLIDVSLLLLEEGICILSTYFFSYYVR